MNIQIEMKELYKKLQFDLNKAFPNNKQYILTLLANNEIYKMLCLRLQYVEIVGILKFKNNITIFAPDIEKEIFRKIANKSKENNLSPETTRIFFKTVIEHSKDFQNRLLKKLANISNTQFDLLFSSKLISLEQKTIINSEATSILSDKLATVDKKLKFCRDQIQNCTNEIIKAMAIYNNKSKKNIDHLKTLSLFSHKKISFHLLNNTGELRIDSRL